MGMRKRLIAGVALLAAIATVLIASPAQAGGGGCKEYSNTAFAFGACQGDNGVYVSGDAYIHRVTTPCTINLRIWEDRLHGTSYVVAEAKYTLDHCTATYKGPLRAKMYPGFKYKTQVVAVSSAGTLNGSSPVSGI